jgi:hypothetical protein
MRRWLPMWFAAVVTALSLGLPAASADDADFKGLHPNAGGFAPSAQLAPADSSAEKVERPPPTLSYAVAVLTAVIVLCLICVPSRKSESSTSR